MKAIAKYAGGFTFKAQAAVRADGAIFRRVQEKTAWGYRWTAWRKSGSCDPASPPETIPCGFSDLRRPTFYTDFNPRLPAV